MNQDCFCDMGRIDDRWKLSKPMHIQETKAAKQFQTCAFRKWKLCVKPINIQETKALQYL